MNSAEIERSTLRKAVKHSLSNYFSSLGSEQPTDFYNTLLAEIERPLLETIIELTGNNQFKMARTLGIARGTLRKKLKKYGLLF